MPTWFDLFDKKPKEAPTKEAPMYKTKKVIGVMELLEHINNSPPDNIARLNSIILNQQQFDMIICDKE